MRDNRSPGRATQKANRQDARGRLAESVAEAHIRASKGIKTKVAGKS